MTHVGLIGLGHWGRNHYKALLELQNQGVIDEITVCDTNEKLLNELQVTDRVHKVKNWKDVVNNAKIDLIDVVTPSPFHFEMTKESLLANKNVLVEKPMGLDAKECTELIEIENNSSAKIMVGHIFRFHPGVNELKKRITRGDFGSIQQIFVRRLTLAPPRKDMGVLLALGIHEVDLTCYLLDDMKPDSIFADLNYFYGDQEESAFIIQKFGKTTAYSYESWIDPTGGKLRELQVIGSKGGAQLNFSVPNKIKLIQSYLDTSKEQYVAINEGEFEITLDFQEPLLEELRHFVTASQTKSEFLANSTIGKRAVEMIDLAFESYKTKKFIEIE